MDELTVLLWSGRDGDRAALEEWVRRLQPDVWRLCAALVDQASASDLTQETFLRAYQSAMSFRGESSSRTWVLSIARRLCADEIRARTRRRRLVARAWSAPVTGLGSSVEVEDLLARLDQDRRAAFVLTQMLGLSYEEAAEACGCPIGTIRSRVARAREDLTAALDERPASSG